MKDRNLRKEIMKDRNLMFKIQNLTAYLLYYITIVVGYFLLIWWQPYHTQGCPYAELFEANFLNQECQAKYDFVWDLEATFVIGGIASYMIVLLFSVIRGFWTIKKLKYQAFLPVILNLIMGFLLFATRKIWLFKLLF